MGAGVRSMPGTGSPWLLASPSTATIPKWLS
jgi:hypothetical protein